jgi:hypothetical protein
MGRITVDKVHLPGITTELREAGYKVDVCPDELIEIPSDREEYAFIEAWKEVTPQEATDEMSCEILYELQDIAHRHGLGECWDAGPVLPDHVPHEYDYNSPWLRRH